MADTLTHAVSIELAAPAAKAFAFMSDPAKLDRWSFGTWRTVLHEGGLVEGQSIFDGAVTWVRIDADPKRGVIDYHLGKSKDALTPRIMARVVPGDRLELGAEASVLTLIAWRLRGMSDERWRRLTTAHEFEVVLIKSLIEAV
ncbi:MAG: SRPBCC family protein [Proteobacteria bacterium]|nr:SRPBCC family protein [Pseudomonadota bacterium]MBI3497430.1 SRPBCC family protein [Pseudomonadota bacterium]